MDIVQKFYVGIAQHKVVAEPALLVCSALGSCVAVCLYDPFARVAGVVHILLPDARHTLKRENPDKFADAGVESLVAEMAGMGAHKKRLRAKIAGGACLFDFGPRGSSSDTEITAVASIGDRNVEAVKAVLALLGIPIVAEDVGERYGRSVYFNSDGGAMRVKSVKSGEKEL
ncbi:MAG: chemotaxis protein CheD [Cloacibacillus sp.]